MGLHRPSLAAHCCNSRLKVAARLIMTCTYIGMTLLLYTTLPSSFSSSSSSRSSSFGFVQAFKDPPLTAYPSARRSDLTISGFSSGAYFAAQMGIALSSSVKGVGIFAGGPFGCAMGDVTVALQVCKTGTPAPANGVTTYVDMAKAYAKQGLIDPLASMARQKIYVYSGLIDQVAYPLVQTQLVSVYKELLPASPAGDNLLFEKLAGAGHTFPTTTTAGVARTCGLTDSKPPFFSDCGFDGVGKMFTHFFGSSSGLSATGGGENEPPLTEWRARASDPAFTGQFSTFDQTAFTNPLLSSLAPTGYLYVPKSCQGVPAARNCRVHVAFHGCLQSISSAGIGTSFVERSGYWQWADSNDIIVLFPQIAASYWPVYNPLSCWDFWGYSDVASTSSSIPPVFPYLTRRGLQIVAIQKMLETILGAALIPPPSPPGTSSPPTPSTPSPSAPTPSSGNNLTPGDPSSPAGPTPSTTPTSPGENVGTTTAACALSTLALCIMALLIIW